MPRCRALAEPGRDPRNPRPRHTPDDGGCEIDHRRCVDRGLGLISAEREDREGLEGEGVEGRWREGHAEAQRRGKVEE